MLVRSEMNRALDNSRQRICRVDKLSVICKNVMKYGNRLPLTEVNQYRSVRRMAIETRSSPSKNAISRLPKAQITIFHCINIAKDISFSEGENYEVKSIKLPCSSMTREIVLLKAFEANADAVIVLVCPEGSCRYIEGNIRAKKRVTRMKKLLDEIGIDGRRLNIFNIDYDDQSTINHIIEQTLADLANLGPNPANLS